MSDRTPRRRLLRCAELALLTAASVALPVTASWSAPVFAWCALATFAVALVLVLLEVRMRRRGHP